MINELFIDVKERMNKAVEHFRHEVSTIRTGRASTTILDGLKVDYYGTQSPLSNIAHVTVPRCIWFLWSVFSGICCLGCVVVPDR